MENSGLTPFVNHPSDPPLDITQGAGFGYFIILRDVKSAKNTS